MPEKYNFPKPQRRYKAHYYICKAVNVPNLWRLAAFAEAGKIRRYHSVLFGDGRNDAPESLLAGAPAVQHDDRVAAAYVGVLYIRVSDLYFQRPSPPA